MSRRPTVAFSSAFPVSCNTFTLKTHAVFANTTSHTHHDNSVYLLKTSCPRILSVRSIRATMTTGPPASTSSTPSSTPPPSPTSSSTSADSLSDSTTSTPISSVSSSTTTTTTTTTSPASLPDLESMSASDRTRIENVRDQLEFWFSATNLRRDWYLRRQMDPQGWLDPSLFLLFNRVKQMRASIQDIITAAHLSEELQVSVPSDSTFGDSAAQTRIRRSPTLPDFREWDDEEPQRSFMLNGIPHDATVDSIKEMLQPLADVPYVHIYRAKIPGAAPRAMVCFHDKQTANDVFSALSADAPDNICGVIIRRRHLPPNSENAQIVAKNNNNNSPMPGGLPVVVLHLTGIAPDIDWKTLHRTLVEAVLLRSGHRVRFMLYDVGSKECYLTILDGPAVRDMVVAIQEDGLYIGAEVYQVRMIDGEQELSDYWEKARAYQDRRKKERAEREAKSEFKNEDKRRPQGVVLKIKGLANTLKWKTLSAELSEHFNIVFLNYKNGNDYCHVRLGSPEIANLFLQKLDNDAPLLIAGHSITAHLLEGEEEEKYWDRVDTRRKMRQARLQDLESEENLNSVSEAEPESRSTSSTDSDFESEPTSEPEYDPTSEQ